MRIREVTIQSARRKGFLDGAASVFYLFGRQRPAPPLVRRGRGSLAGDMRELRRDSDRLFGAGR